MTTTSEFQINLAENFTHLTRAPIVEAVIDIRARAGSNWEEGKILEILNPASTGYPTVRPFKEFIQQVNFQPDSAPTTTMRNPQWAGIRFLSKDGLDIAEFSRDGFMLHRLPPYQGWDRLYHEAMRLWKLYVAAAQPIEIQRVGMRFINRVELPPQEGRFEDYMQPAPQPPLGLHIPFAGFFHQDTLIVPNTPYVINVVRTVQPPQSPSQGASLILDFDVGTAVPLEFDEKSLHQWLEEMRWLKNKAFFGSITQKTMEKYR